MTGFFYHYFYSSYFYWCCYSLMLFTKPFSFTPTHRLENREEYIQYKNLSLYLSLTFSILLPIFSLRFFLSGTCTSVDSNLYKKIFLNNILYSIFSLSLFPCMLYYYNNSLSLSLPIPLSLRIISVYIHAFSCPL